MATVIKTKNGSGAPLASDLVQGELAIDLTNKRLYTENASGTVIELGTVPSTIDINAGTIDGTVIGGSSAAAGSFTTLTASGEITANGGIALGDNDKATFGADDDLQIYHDGSNSYISESGTGGLYLGGSANVRITNPAATETMAEFGVNGAVTLYYDNAQKLATTTTGINVTGTVTADGLTVDSGTLELNSNNLNHTAPTPQYNMIESDVTGNNTQFLQTAGDLRIRTVDDSLANPVERLRIDHATGDISFYDDTGVSQSFYWDASAESLGIGTSSPQEPLHVTGNIRFGDTAPAEIYTNSSELRLGVDRNDDNVASDITFYVNNSEKVRIDSSGNVGIGTTSPAAKLEIGGAGEGIILASPDGTRYKITVANGGTLTVTAV